jgi:hypothetical protein
VTEDEARAEILRRLPDATITRELHWGWPHPLQVTTTAGAEPRAVLLHVSLCGETPEGRVVAFSHPSWAEAERRARAMGGSSAI